MSKIQELAYLQIPLETIKLATGDFSDQNFLGEGGFGKVYKGELPPPTNEVVAVKRLVKDKDKEHGQGQKEFLKEIVTLASYKHDNIVSLLGFCDEDGEKVLVYKHEANGSLDRHLADTELTWEQRLQICLDAARGLKYLHDDVGVGHRVIHRDIKSSNILLDENWNAKISDFGLCKIGPTNEQFSFLVSIAAGTLGYVDPQYMKTGALTKESDVYAFGMVLCEVLCGRLAWVGRYDDERTFLHHLVSRHYHEGSMENIVFSNLRGYMKPHSLKTFSKLAYNCVNKDRRERPTMERVVRELETAIEHQIALQQCTAIDDQIDQGTMIWGSTAGGGIWSFEVGKNQKMQSITIEHHTGIRSIAFTKKDLDGTLHASRRFGGHGGGQGKISKINFDDDEEITGISGSVRTYVASLCFMTNKRKYGPFGRETRKSFSKSWDVGLFSGFYGRCGYELDAIGCFITTV